MVAANDTDPAPDDGDLFVRCDGQLPPKLQAGKSDAIFCVGACFHRRSAVRRLWVRTPSGLTEVGNRSLPRFNLFRDLHAGAADADPERRSYRSGFWSVVPVRPSDPGLARIAVVAELEDGSKVSAPFAEIPVVPPPPKPGGKPERTARIGVCMATFEPDPGLFETQIESIRAQSSRDWVCYISDDHSSESAWEMVRAVAGDDPRFVLSRADQRLGFFRNFERALSMASEDCELIALSDQDDRWYPEKLETLAAAMEDHQLVYSDQRLTLKDGTVIRDTLWAGRSRNENSLYSATIANTIVGASMMLRRDLLDRILPFPHTTGWQFHDHWIAAVALAAGSIRYLDRPLYDYVQHEGAVVGRVSVEEAGEGTHPGMNSSLRNPRQLFSPLRHPKRLLARCRSIYFGSYIHVSLQAQVLLGRCSDRMSGGDSRALRRLIAADRSIVGALELALRPARELWGRNETLGTEWHLLKGIAWLWSVRLRELGRRSPTGARQDATVPEFDILAFGQWRLKRWIRGRSRAETRTQPASRIAARRRTRASR
ncbi:MAG: glycosyltransferase [Solirubrobacterales bacterium]